MNDKNIKTIGDAFSRRREIGEEINAWTQRLTQAGRDFRRYRTKQIDNSKANYMLPEEGTETIYKRVYTIKECVAKLNELIKEDMQLSLRISRTNAIAAANVMMLDGLEQKFSIPELLVFKNDIIPKLESIARAKPIRLDIEFEEKENNILFARKIGKNFDKRKKIHEKNIIEEKYIVDYSIEEITEYGLPKREVYDEIDEIQAFAKRVQRAINQANKTSLVILEEEITL